MAAVRASPIVPLGQVDGGLGEGFRPALAAALVEFDAASFEPEPGRRVERRRVCQGGIDALTLVGFDVQQDGLVDVLDLREELHELRQVVAVDGAHVLEAEPFEKPAGPHGGFHAPVMPFQAAVMASSTAWGICFKKPLVSFLNSS